MADTLNETMENGTAADQQERTFTQEEVNSIIETRLKRESAKYSDYELLKQKASKLDEMEEASKTELQKATERADELQKKLDAMVKTEEVRNVRDKISKETGVPADLLNGETEEDCRSQAIALLAFKNEKAAVYPTVKDGGEVQKTAQKKSVQDQFTDWFAASTSN